MQATSSPVTPEPLQALASPHPSIEFQSEITAYPPVVINQTPAERSHVLVRRRQRAARRSVRGS